MSFAIAIPQFSGPLQLLLELIEKEELPITEISLAAVADDFLAYLQKHEVSPEELSDFLVVATRLLYLKSKAILPQIKLDEEEESASKLAVQLKMYKEFVDASKHLEAVLGKNQPMFERERVIFAQNLEDLPPPENLNTSLVQETFQRLLKRLAPFFSLQKTSMERVVSVQERLNQIRDVITERAKTSFSEVVKGSSSKVDVVISFLALLELVKQRIVHTTQEGAFHDITIKRVD